MRKKPDLVKRIKADAPKRIATLVSSAKDAEHGNAAFLREILS